MEQTHPLMISKVLSHELLTAISDAEMEHGRLPLDHCRSVVILVEEVGEACKEILEIARMERMKEPQAANTAREMAVKELAQVAATAIRLIANIKEELD